MLLSQLLSYVVTLDSAMINIGGAEDGTVPAKYTLKTINALNIAMIEMYTNFPVKQRNMVIQLYSHITEYFLSSKYATTNTLSTETYKYIKDSATNPFLDDVIHIERVFNEEGQEFKLNKEDDPYSLFTPSYNVIQHVYPSNENALFLSYRALPKTIPVAADPDTYEVDIPLQLVNLLVMFTDHKLLAATDKKASSYKLQEYLLQLQKAKTTDLFLADTSVNGKLEDSGWE